jgi:hypothetical protein
MFVRPNVALIEGGRRRIRATASKVRTAYAVLPRLLCVNEEISVLMSRPQNSDDGFSRHFVRLINFCRPSLSIMRVANREIPLWPNWSMRSRTSVATREPGDSLANTCENDFNRPILLLWPKGSLIIGVQNEGAPRIDSKRIEDALVVLARDYTGLATFSVDETDGGAEPRRSSRARCPFRSRRSLIALSTCYRVLPARRKRQQQENDKAGCLHDGNPKLSGVQDQVEEIQEHRHGDDIGKSRFQDGAHGP